MTTTTTNSSHHHELSPTQQVEMVINEEKLVKKTTNLKSFIHSHFDTFLLFVFSFYFKIFFLIFSKNIIFLKNHLYCVFVCVCVYIFVY